MAERTAGTRLFGLRPLDFMKYALCALLACLSAYRIYASYLREAAEVRPQELPPRAAVIPFTASTPASPAASTPPELRLPSPTRSVFDYAPGP